MEKVRIVCDCDAVKAASDVSVCRAINAGMNAGGHVWADYRPEDIKSWHFFSEDIQKKTGDGDLAKRMENYWFDGPTLLAAPVVKNARLASLFMQVLGIEEYIATSRLPHLADSTEKWVGKYFPEIMRNKRLRFKAKEDKREGREFKIGQIVEVGAKAYFEDDPSAIDKVLKDGIIERGRIKMLTWPWNESRRDLDDIRVTGWLEALPFILWLKVSST